MGQSPQPTSHQLSLTPAFGTLANDSLFPFFRPCEGQGPQVSSRCFPVLVIISICDGRCSRICLTKIFHHCVQSWSVKNWREGVHFDQSYNQSCLGKNPYYRRIFFPSYQYVIQGGHGCDRKDSEGVQEAEAEAPL